jgi:hypothetical protein
MPPRLGITLFLGALLLPSAARADPLERGALRLEWRAPGGCPNAVEVLDRVETLLGARVADLAPEPISATGTVTELEPQRFELVLETEQRAQRFARSMQAPTCAELSDAGALVLALAIDPNLVERQAQAARAQSETSALPTEAPTPSAPKPAPEKPRAPVRTLDSPAEPDAPAPREPKRGDTLPEWSARIGVVADFGTVADVAFGPRATGEAGWDAFRLDVGFVWLPPARSITAENPQRGGDIDLVAGELSACFLPLRGKLEVGGCADAEIGRLHGAGFGTVTEDEGTALWLGFGASGLGRLAATDSIALVANVGFLAPTQEIEFTLENVGLVHRIPSVVGRVGLGVETEFE